MNVIYWIVLVLLVSLLGWGMLLGFADAMLRRRHDDMLEMRRWHDTVEAMRRMAHREGDA